MCAISRRVKGGVGGVCFRTGEESVGEELQGSRCGDWRYRTTSVTVLARWQTVDCVGEAVGSRKPGGGFSLSARGGRDGAARLKSEISKGRIANSTGQDAPQAAAKDYLPCR